MAKNWQKKQIQQKTAIANLLHHSSKKEDLSVSTHTRKKKSRLLIPALLLICAIGIVLYLIPSVYTPGPSVSLSKAISNLDTALESGSSIDFPTAADQVFSHWCIAIQEER